MIPTAGRRWFVTPFVLAFLLSLTLCYASYDPIPPRVNVRWSERVTPSQRVALEAAYRFADPEYKGERTWSYGLLDTSTDNIQRLVQDPAADDTHLIDRKTFALTDPPPAPLFVLFRFVVVSSLIGIVVASFFMGVAILQRRAWWRWRAFLDTRRSAAVDGRHSRRVAAFVVILVGIVAAAVRFLTIKGFNNDHFVHLSAAQQMLFGDWPTRDFIDIGRPLTIAASAAAQSLIGHNLFAEAVLVSVGFGIAAALTLAIVSELTGSLLLGFGAAVLEVAAFPRTYHYPKLLATAACLWLIGYFLRRPGFVRQCVMAGGVAIAFLFRHDIGVFVGAGGLVASIVAPAGSWRERRRGSMRFFVLVAVMVAPYLAYVQLHAGLWNYIATALQGDRLELSHDWPNPFATDAPAESRLVYVFHFLPLVAMGTCALEWKRIRDQWSAHFVIAVAFVAVAENFDLMRAPKIRVADAIVPALVLGAWLVHRAWRADPRRLFIPLAIACLGVGVLIGGLGDTGSHLAEAGLTSETIVQPRRVLQQFTRRAAELRDRFANDPPSRAIVSLRPFFSYLDRCTTTQHRLFLVGMIPEVAYYAQRPFAGGAYEHFNFTLQANQRRVVDRLSRQVVPFVLIASDYAQDFERNATAVADYVRGRYVPLTEVSVREDTHIQVLIDRGLLAASRDKTTGWPCLR